MFIDKDWLKDKYFYYRGIVGSIETKTNSEGRQYYCGSFVREYHDNGWKPLDEGEYLENTYESSDLEGLYYEFTLTVDEYYKHKNYNIGETFFNKM